MLVMRLVGTRGVCFGQGFGVIGTLRPKKNYTNIFSEAKLNLSPISGRGSAGPIGLNTWRFGNRFNEFPEITII